MPLGFFFSIEFFWCLSIAQHLRKLISRRVYYDCKTVWHSWYYFDAHFVISEQRIIHKARLHGIMILLTLDFSNRQRWREKGSKNCSLILYVFRYDYVKLFMQIFRVFWIWTIIYIYCIFIMYTCML